VSVLKGTHLFLRDYEAADFEAVHAYAQDPEVVRYMVWGPNSESETREFLATARSQATAEPRTVYELAVVETSSGKLVGGIGLRPDKLQAMLGYCFSRPSWGQGFATEASRLLVGFGFESLGLHRIWARCDAENLGSLRVLEKVGMRREGVFFQDCQIRGEWRNTVLMAMLKDEWMS
jgi:RimJ/RimL family protein N-acetyltransferase